LRESRRGKRGELRGDRLGSIRANQYGFRGSEIRKESTEGKKTVSERKQKKFRWGQSRRGTSHDFHHSKRKRKRGKFGGGGGGGRGGIGRKLQKLQN